MDFGDLLILLLFLFPILSRLFGKKKPPAAGRQQVPPADSPLAPSSGDDPLGAALRQIRDALGEGQPPEPRLPKPSAATHDAGLGGTIPPTDPVPPSRLVRARKASGKEFHEVGAFEHEAHGFGRENPLSEEVFEQQAAFEPTTKQIDEHALDDVDLTTPIEVRRNGRTSSSLALLLRDPNRAREAFALKEILGPRRGLGPRR